MENFEVMHEEKYAFVDSIVVLVCCYPEAICQRRKISFG